MQNEITSLYPPTQPLSKRQRSAIRKWGTLDERFWGRVDKSAANGCWEWLGNIKRNGYGTFMANGRCFNVHRLAWVICNGQVPDGQCVMHICDNRKCVNPAHLMVGTAKDNTQDMIRKGRHKSGPPMRGDDHPMARLTAKQVLELRKQYDSGTLGPASRMSLSLGLSEGALWRVVTRKTWKHI